MDKISVISTEHLLSLTMRKASIHLECHIEPECQHRLQYMPRGPPWGAEIDPDLIVTNGAAHPPTPETAGQLGANRRQADPRPRLGSSAGCACGSVKLLALLGRAGPFDQRTWELLHRGHPSCVQTMNIIAAWQTHVINISCSRSYVHKQPSVKRPRISTFLEVIVRSPILQANDLRARAGKRLVADLPRPRVLPHRNGEHLDRLRCRVLGLLADLDRRQLPHRARIIVGHPGRLVALQPAEEAGLVLPEIERARQDAAVLRPDPAAM